MTSYYLTKLKYEEIANNEAQYDTQKKTENYTTGLHQMRRE